MDVIQRCRAGDQGAFAALFDQHKNLVYKTAYLLLGDTRAAEDALQEVFVKVYLSLETFDPGKGTFTTWLRRITVNHCLNVRRKRRFSFITLEDPAVRLSPPIETRRLFLPEGLALDREQAESVWQAVQSLSLPLRAALVLRYYQDLSYQEIAQVLDIPLGTAKWRVHQALKNLRKELEGTTEVYVPSRSRTGQEEVSP